MVYAYRVHTSIQGAEEVRALYIYVSDEEQTSFLKFYLSNSSQVGAPFDIVSDTVKKCLFIFHSNISFAV